MTPRPILAWIFRVNPELCPCSSGARRCGSSASNGAGMPGDSHVLSPPAPFQSGLKKTLADRFLSLFAEVRGGEGIGALLLCANVYVLLEAYYILKTVREALILSEGSAEIKTYSSALQAALLLLVIPAYGALASRVNRDRLITFVTIFFASHLVVFYLLGQAGVRVGVLFFLWVGIFNLFVIAQFWGFANDLYNKEQGKRLLPIVGI